MDDPNEYAKAKSPALELMSGALAVGLIIGAAMAPAALVGGFYVLAGLAFYVTIVASLDRARACRADEPCQWAQGQRCHSPAPSCPAIDITADVAQEESRWANAIREAKVADTQRCR